MFSHEELHISWFILNKIIDAILIADIILQFFIARLDKDWHYIIDKK